MTSIVGTSIHLDGIGHLVADSKLRVPVYQRSFSWSTEEIDELLSDLWESFRRGETEYFLGSVVLTGGDAGPAVVDGQQRLATISMIYAAIRDFLKREKDGRAGPFETQYLFSLNFKTEEIEPKLRLNEMDDGFFRAEVLAEKKGVNKPTATADSHKRIRVGFQRVCAAVAKYAETSKNQVGILMEWTEFLEKQAKVIVVSVPDEANAFVIFETLNDRGLDLSIADLLKNYVFGKSENRIDEARAAWLKATSALEGTGGDKRVATFIRHFWASKRGPTREKELYGDLKRSIKTKQSAVDFVVELADNARLYAAILNSDHELWHPLGTDARQHVLTLLNLRLEQYRPLLLACIAKFSPNELKKALRLLVSWNVRLLVVGGIGGGTMERQYAVGGKKVRDGEIKNSTDLAKWAIDFIPGDAQFEGAFASATVSQAFLARYYLQAIERSLGNEKNPELVPNTLEKDVNLEHVLPQNAKLKEWPKFNEESAAGHVKRIGNLTLLQADINNDGGNKPFAQKLAAYKKSKLRLNESVATVAEWSPTAISTRQQKLAAFAVNTWPLK
jgi:Protein of unknown function DUF262/Protein of unknown function (DUF1524)